MYGKLNEFFQRRRGKSGLRLTARRAACEQFAHNHGYEVVAEFREVQTGKGADALDRRPRPAAALAMAKKLKCPVLVAKLDRLSRHVAFIAGPMAKRAPLAM